MEDNKKVKFSIIIPIYNIKKSLFQIALIL